MAKKLDMNAAAKQRTDARNLETHADSSKRYPPGTVVRRGQGPSRMFNIRLTDQQYRALEDIARDKHLPISTMARAWLLDRLDRERHAS